MKFVVESPVRSAVLEPDADVDALCSLLPQALNAPPATTEPLNAAAIVKKLLREKLVVISGPFILLPPLEYLSLSYSENLKIC